MMLLNSYTFIFAFLPLLLAVYFLCARLKKVWLNEIILIVASVLFYTAFDVRVAAVLFASVVVNYLCLCFIGAKRTRMSVMLPILLNVILLLYYKYTDFFIENINSVSGSHLPLRQIALPLGISFFTFQQIAYIVSFYRGELTEEKIRKQTTSVKEKQFPDFLDYAAFILYFPKLIMGPLMEPADFLAQIHDVSNKKISAENIACGVKIFSYGLFKKMILADTFAAAVNWGLANPAWPSSLDWMLIILFNSFMIYFDFSGYTDMAVGVSQMLNITLPINFDSPYKALSIRDFWKRWHISLTKFLTKYLYLPLGGNRQGMVRTCINVMLVFFISGLWHGANMTFVVWGLLHGAFSVAERLAGQIPHGERRETARGIERIVSFVKGGVTFFIVSLLWMLFSAPTISLWADILGKTFSFQNMTLNISLLGAFSIPESTVFMLPFFDARFLQNAAKIWMVVFILTASFICFVPENNYKNLSKLTYKDIVLASICFVCGVMALGQESVFVYFNF